MAEFTYRAEVEFTVEAGREWWYVAERMPHWLEGMTDEIPDQRASGGVLRVTGSRLLSGTLGVDERMSVLWVVPEDTSEDGGGGNL